MYLALQELVFQQEHTRKNNMKKYLTNFIFSMIFSCYAHAGNSIDCSSKENTLAIVGCHNQRYILADKNLNLIYSAVIKNLSEGEKTKLRDSQRAWIKFRDIDFDLIVEMNRDLGSYGNIAISAFKATFVENRVEELKEILTSPGEETKEKCYDKRYIEIRNYRITELKNSGHMGPHAEQELVSQGVRMLLKEDCKK